jgi:hypothetical protein
VTPAVIKLVVLLPGLICNKVRTMPMIAISFAMIMSPFATIVSLGRNPSCDQCAHTPPMIATMPPFGTKQAIGNALDDFYPEECFNYSRNAGYGST